MMHLKDKIKIYSRKKIIDSRGWFLKVINGKEDDLPNFTGEVYLICGNIGETRANHYHKEASEWFTLIKGKALMMLEDVITKEKIQIELDSTNPKTIYVPNNIAHAFKNINNENYILVAYADVLYNPEDTIRYIL